MPKITPDEKGLTINLDGIQKILSLKGQIRIPWKSISKISDVKPKWLIFTPKAGTNLPAVLMAGTFYRRKGKSFYYVRHLDKCITFSLKNHQFVEIVVEVREKEKQLTKLNDLLKKFK